MAYIGVQPKAGQYRKLDNISGSFNGSTTQFNTQVSGQSVTLGTAQAAIISLGGVIQNPGTDYTVGIGTITFTTAPSSGLSFFGVLMGEPVNTGTPGDGTVTGAKLSDPFNFDSGTFYLDGTNNRVGIGTTSNYDDSVLEVRKASGGDGVAIRVTNDTTTNGSLAGIIFTNSTSDFTSAAIAHKRNDGALIFFNGQTAGGGGFANATEAMRLDSSNRLLVGTSTALTGGDTQYSTLQIQNNSFGAGTPAYLALSRSGSLTSTDLPVGRIWFGGSGTDVRADISAFTDGTSGGSGDTPGRLVFSTTADGASSPTERMRITNNGSTLINTTSVAASGSILSLGGTITWGVGPQPGGSTFYVYNPSNVGVYITSGANAWSASSDERLKNITGTITDGLNKVNSLRAVKFSWLSDEHNTPQVGLIAQDVQAVLPEAITEDNGYLGVKYSEVIPLLVSALKEAKGRIETLEAEVAALKGA